MSTLTRPTDDLTKFLWETQPSAQRVVDRLIATLLAGSPAARRMKQQMTDITGTRFFDWLDHVALPADAALEAQLVETGFVKSPAPQGVVFHHPGAIFPRIRFQPGRPRLVIKVDSVVDYAATHALQHAIVGEPLARVRTVQHDDTQESTTDLFAIERHGWPTFETPTFDAHLAVRALEHLEHFRARRRDFGPAPNDTAKAFAHTHELVDAAIADLGVAWSADLFFAAERDYWMRRNKAARVQYARQCKLGLGWANHDHHTYRSSRDSFAALISVLEKLGLFCRERFYPGKHAGWGAQVLESPDTGVVVFADVDLSPEEIKRDFAHEPLPDSAALATVGLWTALHGESMQQAGMHHLECQFDFDALRAQLKAESGIAMMNPFSAWDHLKQQFTEGERFAVDARRVDRLVAMKLISDADGEKFKREGAIGSHLENLERNDGYKGFNQTGITDIINETDPRRQ